jgi:predicted O-methyltransferase YrrM
MSSINEYLKNKGYFNFEGYVRNSDQINDLIFLSKNIKSILEIGFNTGNSSDIFLSNNKDVFIVSFDIGSHLYISSAKEYIDNNYPNRHILIIGNSIYTIPSFYKNLSITFDLIFIDGGHEYNTAKQDILNCKYLSHKNTIIIVDDIIQNSNLHTAYTVGPTLAWNECINNNIIIELGYKEYDNGTGMAYGKYIL